jgi:two-component system OmpR family response regulator
MRPLRHILCVDDEDDILLVLKLCLELDAKLEVSCCGSGLEALNRIPQIRPDLVLLDVMMPGMDGPDTFARMRALPVGADVPVVFLTARMREAQTEEYLRLGASGVMAKPFDPVTLASDLDRIWGRIQEKTA